MKKFGLLFIFFPILCLKEVNSDILDCRKEIDRIERKFKIPYKLLSAISITESGRTVNGQFVAWPWAFNVSGKSFYFENKKNAKLFLKEKISERKNIDIGCMQINYGYHKESFKNLENFIDPIQNISWAAKYLKTLYSRYNSWNIAISRYHSSNPERMKNYLLKVKNNWRKERERKVLTGDEIYKQKIFYKKNQKKINRFRSLLEKSKQKIL